MSLAIASLIPGEGSVLLTDSIVRSASEATFNARKNFRVGSIGVFASGTFTNLPALIGARTETNIDDAASRLFADLKQADLTEGAPYSPQLLVADYHSIALLTPTFSAKAVDEPAMFAAGGWVSWFLSFEMICVTSERYRLPADMPGSLNECKVMMRQLAQRAVRLWQSPRLVGAPLYELTLTAGGVVEEQIT